MPNLVHHGFLLFYGTLSVSVLLLTLCQPVRVLWQLAAIMVASWAVCNVAVQAMGFAGAPLIAPSLDGALALLAAWLGHKTRSFTAFVVVCLFVIEESVSIAGIAFAQTNTRVYYSALNAVFLAQVLAIGYAAAREIQLAGFGRSVQCLLDRGSRAKGTG